MSHKIQIIRQRRASLSLQITRDARIIVKAPHLLPDFLINQFLDSKKDWIDKTVAKVSAHMPKKKTYTEGEEFFYLGIAHKLQFYSGAEIVAKNNILYFPKGAAFRIQKELEGWYKKQAQDIITQRVKHHSEKMQARYKDVFFSDTISKWGTCFADNTLQFNWRLIMTPIMVMDYVVIHELTHTTEKHHQDSFWRRVRLFTPAYKQHRKWLNEHAQMLQF